MWIYIDRKYDEKSVLNRKVQKLAVFRRPQIAFVVSCYNHSAFHVSNQYALFNVDILLKS